MNKKIAVKKTGKPPAVLTHMDIIKTRLDVLKPNITPADRREACREFSLTKATISKYLSGQAMATETGLDLLAFFHDRVTAREERLKSFIA